MLSREQLRQHCRNKFSFFGCLMQGEGYFDPVHGELCNFLQEVSKKERDPHALVVMPRGSYKTTMVSKWFPIWMTINDPNFRWLIVSNTMTNASMKLREIRGVYESHPVFRALFPELIPNFGKVIWNDKTATINRTEDWAEGTFEAAGTRTKVIGRHYNGIIEDDTCAPDLSDVNSEHVLPDPHDIEQAIGYHKLAYPLLIKPSKGIRAVVGTRWSHDDIIQHIQDNDHTYEEFNRKAMTNFPDGEAPFSHIDVETLKALRYTMGKFMFNALYLNDPMRPDDMVFRPEHLRSYKEAGLRSAPECDWVISVDPAVSNKKDACDTAIVRVGHARPMMYVDAAISGKFTPIQTAQHVINLIRLDYENTKWVGVETVGYQEVLCYIIEDMMREQNLWFPIQHIPPQKSKQDRILSMQPYFERGQIILNDNMDEMRQQLLNYPHTNQKDLIDALSMQILSYQGVERRVSRPRPKATSGYTLEDILESVRPKRRPRNTVRNYACSRTPIRIAHAIKEEHYEKSTNRSGFDRR